MFDRVILIRIPSSFHIISSTYLCNTFKGATHGQDPIMNALNNLGDTGLGSGRVSQLGNVLAS